MTIEEQIVKVKADIFDLIKAGELINGRRIALLKDLEELQAIQMQPKEVKVEGESGNE